MPFVKCFWMRGGTDGERGRDGGHGQGKSGSKIMKKGKVGGVSE